jgi:predicted GIY-YIG superfamily endonuclease
MKEKSVDYSATLIYKITCKDPIVTDLYVGHTTNFVQRRDQHKQSSVNSDGKLYNFIRNNGGWANWTMEIIHFFNCKNLFEAKTKEQEYFVSLKATLNSIEPMPSIKETVINIKSPENIESETTEPSTVKKTRFMCIKCNYNCNKQSEFDKHLLTVKHNKIIQTLNDPIKHKCKCGNLYKYRQGLSLHKKTCIITKENTSCKTLENNNNSESLTKDKEDFNTVVLDMLKNMCKIQKQILEILKNK